MMDSYHKLLCRYSAYMRRAGHVDAAAVALRTRSESIRDVIAYVATHDQYTAVELHGFVCAGALPEIQFRYKWLATLGRVAALQAFQTPDPQKYDADTNFGLACLQVANRHIAQDNDHKHFHRLEAELLSQQGRIAEAAQLLQSNEYLVDYYYGYLLADLDNPTVSGVAQSYDKWWNGFNRPFLENDLPPINFTSKVPTFNDLRVTPCPPITGGPKVTVVMTSYKPDPEPFLLAVRSILNQTWKNLELIIVDDASPSEFGAVLNQARDLDPRVIVIKLPENGGTYRARNVGLGIASGQFITGQDSDDWSHPERIAFQMDSLLNEPAISGVLVEAIRVNESLVRTFPGRLPQRQCEVSLMTHTSLAKELGGYIEARKGADSEFRLRLEYFTGYKAHAIMKPLYLTRIGHESLSGADFKPGWSHPVRRAFWNASRYWHKNTKPAQLRLTESGFEPLPIPNRFKVHPPTKAPHFDVVFVGDWRAYSGTQRAMIDEIGAHQDEGHHIGIMHLESLMSPSKETRTLSQEIQGLIHEGIVVEVVPDENATTRLVRIYDPTILQFSPLYGINLTSELTLISPDMAPHTGHKETVLYRPEDCNQVAEKIFCGAVAWTSVDTTIRRVLAEYANKINVLSMSLPVVFRAHEWKNTRQKLAGYQPIVGRHSENYPEYWPKKHETARQVWAQEGSTDVYILGDARPYLRKYDRQNYPRNWLVFRDRDINPKAFMSGIDFFVYFPDEEYDQGFSREALEAAASGAIVILPEKFKEMHGCSAIYAIPSQVQSILESLTLEKYRYREKTVEVQSYIEKYFSNNGYIEYVRDLLSDWSPNRSLDPEKACKQ